MFWNSGPDRIFGRHLKDSGLKGDDAIITMDDGWNGFLQTMPSDSDLIQMKPQDIADSIGLEEIDMGAVISRSMRRWRNSPSSSLVNIIGDAEQGSAGQPMFGTLRTQTQILAAAIESEAIKERSLLGVSGDDNKRKQIAADAYAMTATGEAAIRVNALARAFRVWEERSRALIRTGAVKLPKKLYRGVRSRDLAATGFVHNPDRPHPLSRCDRLAYLNDWLTTLPLASASHSDILSFTANRPIAEYFANGEGFVFEVDPTEMTLIAGWSTEEALAGPDPVTNKAEREWIMRVGSLRLKPQNIHMRDVDMAVATNDPLGIEMLNSGSFYSADYELEGRNIHARFVYNNNGRGGHIKYAVDGYCLEKRSVVKREFGIDPVPGDRPVENLRYEVRDSMGIRPNKPAVRWEPLPGVSPKAA